ncbi:MAG: cryptochrome/photolyase family protein [Rickettsiaceae bacterium]
MTNLRLILYDQLTYDISSLSDIDKDNDLVMMVELYSEFTYVKHHKKKIAFLLSAMRHFAAELSDLDINLCYIKLEDRNNKNSLQDQVAEVIGKYSIKKVIVTRPSEYRILQEIEKWRNIIKVPVEIREDNRFLCTPKEFSKWAGDRKNLKMEFFYRRMRKKHNILMDGNKPEGGKWNYDSENRKPPQKNLNVPEKYEIKPDQITIEAIKLVDKYFFDHFGDLEPFFFAVTRNDARLALKDFIEKRLEKFGDYQDSMIENEPWMFHSHLSFYLNCGLLTATECVKAVEDAYRERYLPINAVEGFIRQIVGWREYIRGIYWHRMPSYKNENFFGAERKLPEFFWNANSKMNCVNQCVRETKEHAYAHHIQRLMVLGNFALLAGIDPDKVNEWYLIVYADAYEWVELPNVTGMILFADGGYLASKPYAASGSYINKMSNYCKNCSFKVNKKNGQGACPFNYLYWNFLVQNRSKLGKNPRISMIYRTYDKMSEERKKEIKSDSQNFLNRIKYEN